MFLRPSDKPSKLRRMYQLRRLKSQFVIRVKSSLLSFIYREMAQNDTN